MLDAKMETEPMRNVILKRIEHFKSIARIEHPILLAPMAGACPANLSAAVANAGGMGACGALLYTPEQIDNWCMDFRRQSDGPFQINLWTPDPAPKRDLSHERLVAEALSGWGPAVDQEAANTSLIDFDSQVEAVLKARPTAFSTIMGIPSKAIIDALHEREILWFATITTVGEAIAAAEAGADVLMAQGCEAGGHRGAFDADHAERQAVGSLALIPAVADVTDLPIIAAGGIADARTAIAALMLGASAVQIGTGFLRTPEAALNPAWADGLSKARPEDTGVTRGFSGRAGRALRTRYVAAIENGTLPRPAPYPVQRALTAAMRNEAASAKDLDRMQAWAGQSAAMASNKPAAEIVSSIGTAIRTFFA